jgi:hypothetical protein
VAAACLGAAASAVGGAAIITLLHTAAPFWDVWRLWFLSDGVGIVVVAPPIISLSQMWREPPSRGEWINGVGGVAFLSLISLYAVGHPTGSWLSFDSDALALPPLLWLTARCPPVFGIVGAFVTSFAFICATTLGIGHFGNENIPIMERVNGTQAVITMVTIYTLVLAALFTERRRNEAALESTLRAEKESKTRLADAMSAGQVMAFERNAPNQGTRFRLNPESDPKTTWVYSDALAPDWQHPHPMVSKNCVEEPSAAGLVPAAFRTSRTQW